MASIGLALSLVLLAATPEGAAAGGASPEVAAPEARPAELPGPAAAVEAAPLPLLPYLGAGFGTAVPLGFGESGSAVRIRAGLARSQRLLFGLEAGMADLGSGRLSFLDVGATFHPWSWLFLRSAVGLTILERQLPIAQLEQGSNFLLGAGCAIGGRPGFDLTLNLEYQRHLTGVAGSSLGDGGTGHLTAWVGLEWL